MDRPTLIVLDVNETLSDLSGLDGAFAAAGLEPGEREAWFAGVLRDGFALSAVGQNPGFAEVASEALRLRLVARGAADPEAGAAEVMEAFTRLDVHADVAPGLRALHAAGTRLVTLSNGSASVADALLERAGLADVVEQTLSVADGPGWKPLAGAYTRALDVCGVAAGEAMLVAVHPWDLDGAARAGLRTGWVRRGAAGWPAYALAPEVEADDLVGLADLLGA